MTALSGKICMEQVSQSFGFRARTRLCSNVTWKLRLMILNRNSPEMCFKGKEVKPCLPNQVGMSRKLGQMAKLANEHCPKHARSQLHHVSSRGIQGLWLKAMNLARVGDRIAKWARLSSTVLKYLPQHSHKTKFVRSIQTKTYQYLTPVY